jgi:hypothetical protein
MVSNADRRRAERRPLTAFFSAALLVASVAASCSRKADIRDEPDSGTQPAPEVPLPDGGIPELEDSGLDDTEFPECESREEDQDCRGVNDFPCDFAYWVPVLAEECQQATGCRTNGWIEIELADDGCASALNMDQPNDDFVACVVNELGTHRCPCDAQSVRHFLGLANDGCTTVDDDCRSGEFPCDVGQICVDGKCVVDTGAAGQSG